MVPCWVLSSVRAAVDEGSAERAIITETISGAQDLAVVFFEVDSEGAAADLTVVVHV